MVVVEDLRHRAPTRPAGQDLLLGHGRGPVFGVEQVQHADGGDVGLHAALGARGHPDPLAELEVPRTRPNGHVVVASRRRPWLCGVGDGGGGGLIAAVSRTVSRAGAVAENGAVVTRRLKGRRRVPPSLGCLRRPGLPSRRRRAASAVAASSISSGTGGCGVGTALEFGDLGKRRVELLGQARAVASCPTRGPVRLRRCRIQIDLQAEPVGAFAQIGQLRGRGFRGRPVGVARVAELLPRAVLRRRGLPDRVLTVPAGLEGSIGELVEQLAAALRSVSRPSSAAASCSGSSAWLSSRSRRRSSNAATRNVIRTTRSGGRVAEVIEPAS